MRYLLDTNIFIFACTDMEEIAPDVAKILADYENSFILSVESIREIVMLIKGGKISDKIWRSYADIRASLDAHGIEIRYISESHLKTLYNLRPASHPSDLADLMIIAQAITEDIPLISSDTKFPLYIRQGLKSVLNKRPNAKL